MSIPVKLPVLKEITFHIFSQENIRKQLSEEMLHYLGPVLINLESLQGSRLQETLNFIEMALSNLKICPPYPYPLFILAPSLKSHPRLCIFQKRTQIPGHFQYATETITKKEAQQLKKLLVYRQKMLGHDYQQKNLKIKKSLKNNRAYFEKSLESELLSHLLKELKQ
jgi:hypothetical protein